MSTKNRKSKKRKTNKMKKLGLLLGVIVSGIAVFNFTKEALIFGHKKISPPKITVYDRVINKLDYSNTLNPNFSNLAEFNTKETSDHYYLVGETQTSFKNNLEKNIRLDKAQVNILNSQEYYHTEIVLVQGLHNDYLDLYFLNNGNQNSEPLEFILEAEIDVKHDSTQQKIKLNETDFDELMEDSYSKKVTLDGGEIERVYHLDVSNKLKNVFKENNDYQTITFKLSEKKSKQAFVIHSLMYDEANDRLTYGGMGSGMQPIDYKIVELDPDNMLSEYPVNNIDIPIVAGETNFSSLLFVAKKSMTVEFTIDYFYENNLITFGDPLTMNIFVPLYNITSTLPNNELFQKLTEHDITHFNYADAAIVEDSIKYDYNYIYNFFKDIE